MTKPNRKRMEQLWIGKEKHTNMSTYAPPSDGGLLGSSKPYRSETLQNPF